MTKEIHAKFIISHATTRENARKVDWKIVHEKAEVSPDHENFSSHDETATWRSQGFSFALALTSSQYLIIFQNISAEKSSRIFNDDVNWEKHKFSTSQQSGRSLDRWLLFCSTSKIDFKDLREFPSLLCALIPWKILEIFLSIPEKFCYWNTPKTTTCLQKHLSTIHQHKLPTIKQRQIKVSFWQPFSHLRTPTQNLRPSIFHKTWTWKVSPPSTVHIVPGEDLSSDKKSVFQFFLPI